MKHSVFKTWPLLGLGIVALLAVGCSDDDDNGNPAGPGGGGMADSTTFQLVNQNVDMFDFESIGNSIEITNAGLEQAFPTLFNSPKGKTLSGRALGADSIIVNSNLSYTDGGDWHVFVGSVSITDTEEGVTLTYEVIDSVQFRMDATVLQEPNDSVNTIETRKHFDWWRSPDSLVYGDGSHALVVGLEPDPADSSELLITLNGTADESTHLEFIEDGADCMLDFDAVQTLTNLQFSGADTGNSDCPSSGSATAGATIGLLCVSASDTLQVNASWTVTTTVLQNGDLQVVYDDGTTTWTVTTTCEEAQSGGKDNGDLSDENIEAVFSLFSQHEQRDTELLSVIGLVGDSVFSPSSSQSPRDRSRLPGRSLGADTAVTTLVYNEGSGYWVFTYQDFSEEELAASSVSSLTASDSVKFYVGENAVQYPASPEVVTKIHTAGSLVEDHGSLGLVAVTQDYEITGEPLTGETMIVNGTSVLQINGNGLLDPVCMSQVTADAMKTSVHYDIADLSVFCPPDGQIDWTSRVYLNCPDTTDTLMIDDLWSVQIVYDNPEVHVTAENSTTRWVQTDTCVIFAQRLSSPFEPNR